MSFLLSAWLFILSASAHEVPHAHEEEKDKGKNSHNQKIQVLGNYHTSSLLDIVPTVTTLSGENLLRKRTTSLGETLKNEVGINATSYGPTASRPVIRGLDGDRIRILQNGIGVLDASGASQDHAVPIDPLSSESIEVVRGPITLLYGSSAVGGVVNIVNSRIHEEYMEGFNGAVDAQGTSVNSGKSLGGKVDYGAKNWMFHFDGSYNNTKDMNIPGYARTAELRATAPVNPEPKDKLPNSESEIASAAVGTTYTGDFGYLGLSASTFENKYGVVAEPGVDIDMEQQRFDLAGEWKKSSWFKAIRLKSAQSIYQHKEMEDGAAGTQFKNNGNETRLEFAQKKRGSWSGLFGLQSNFFEFSALGDEAFLPTTKNSSVALFIFEEWDYEKIKWNIGVRGEVSQVRPEASGNFTFTDKKSFDTGSVAAGLLYALGSHISTGLNVSYNERAPTYQELFADGNHVATFTYQQGDPNLGKESSMAAEWSLRHQSNSFTGTLNLFGQRFNDYIALVPTGAVSTEGLPVYAYIAQEADIYGAEMDMHWTVNSKVPGHLSMQVKGDYVRGKNRVTGDNLPRISPPRASVGLLHDINNWNSDIELQQVFRQSRIAPNETETGDYLQTNLGVAYKISRTQSQTTIYGRVNNVFNVETRNHVSFLKDIAPGPGTNFILGVRSYF